MKKNASQKASEELIEGLVKYQAGLDLVSESVTAYFEPIAELIGKGLSQREIPRIEERIVLKPASPKINFITLVGGPIVAVLSYWLFSLPKTSEVAWYFNQLLGAIILASIGLTLTALVSLLEKKKTE